MVAGVGGAEGEFTCVRTLGVDDAVVVVEYFVDGDGYTEIGVYGEGGCLGLDLEGGVVACGIVLVDMACEQGLRCGLRGVWLGKGDMV